MRASAARRVAAAVATTLALAALTAGGARAGAADPPTGGGLGLRLLDAPADVDDPRALLYVIDHVAPDTVLERRVEVSNTIDAPLQVSLYAAAASIRDGAFVGAAGHDANDLSSWTTVAPRTVAVPAAGAVEALVTIAIPADAAPGEQYAAVWAEVRTAETVPTEGVTEVSRVGVRLYISVGPGGAPAPDFVVDSVTASRDREGRPVLHAQVRNTGGRALEMAGSLELTGGPGGLSAGPYPVTVGTTLAPGHAEPVAVVLDRTLPAGPWDAEVVLRSGRLERRAEASILFPDTGSAPPVAVAGPGRSWTLPIVAAAVFVVVAVGFGGRRHSRRRRPRWALDG